MPPPSSTIDHDLFRRLSVLLLTAGISILFLFVVWDFLIPLLLGGIFASLLHPVYQRLLGWLGGRRVVASIVTLILTVVLIGIPLLVLMSVIAEQALGVSESSFAWVQHHMGKTDIDAHEAKLIERFPFLDGLLPERERVIDAVAKIASKLGSFLVQSLATATTGAASFLLNAFVMLYAIFTFLIQGPDLLNKLLYYLPLTPSDKKMILARFVEVSRATIKGSLVIGFIQGTLGGIGLHFAGLDGAVFWGTIMMILSVIPGIGAPLIWVPAVCILLFRDETLPAVLLTVWGAGVVGSIDNLLRPILVGKDAKLPDLLILIGTLGGIFLFGAAGFIIGPIICALSITIWQIYGVAYHEALDDETPPTGTA